MADPGTSVIASANAAVRFLLELAALVAFGYWGYSLGTTQPVKLGVGIGLPLFVAVVWAAFGSPAAPYRLGQPWRLGLELGIMIGAALAVYLLDRPVLAAGYALVALLNTALLYGLGRS